MNDFRDSDTFLHESLLKEREDSRRELSPAEQLHDMLLECGIETEVIDIPENESFHSIVLFPGRARTTNEPFVRVYRGINQLNETVLDQVPYALRSREKEDAEAPLTILNHARAEVDALTEHPTYENLLRYVDAVWPDLTDKEIERFAKKLEKIEDGVLSGIPLRIELVHATYEFHGGVYADTGIAPYISASTDPNEAGAYGRGGVMVIDLPVSKIDAVAVRTKGEIVIKGAIPPEYITALLPRTRGFVPQESKAEKDIARICEVIDARVQSPVLVGQKMEEVFQEICQRERAEDAAQHARDVAMIQERRAKKISEEFRDIRVSKEEVADVQLQENTDVYTATRRVMYDKLVARFEAAKGRREMLEEEYVYESHFDFDTRETSKTHYTRNHVTDNMLKKLRDIVRNREDYIELRRKRAELDKLA